MNREVMAAVANSYAPGLQGFLDAIKKLNIPNFIVIAIDKPLAENLKSQGVPYYFKENAAQGNHKAGGNRQYISRIRFPREEKSHTPPISRSRTFVRPVCPFSLSAQVSAQKFSLLKEFVGVGCSVLLTDTDVVYLQNPFGADGRMTQQVTQRCEHTEVRRCSL